MGKAFFQGSGSIAPGFQEDEDLCNRRRCGPVGTVQIRGIQSRAAGVVGCTDQLADWNGRRGADSSSARTLESVLSLHPPHAGIELVAAGGSSDHDQEELGWLAARGARRDVEIGGGMQ